MSRLPIVRVAAVTVLVLTVVSPAWSGLKRSVEALELEVQQLLNDGKLVEALPLAETIVTTIAGQYLNDDTRLDSPLERLGILRLQTGHAPEAETAARQLLALRERRFGAGASQTAASRTLLGTILSERIEAAMAEEQFTIVLAASPAAADAIWLGINDVALYNLMLLYANQGADDKAIHAGARDLELRERLYGPEDPRTADTLETIAFIRGRKADSEAAVELYERALTIRRAHKSTDPASLEKLLDAAGTFYERRAQYVRAHEIYHETLLLARERTDGTPKVVVALKSLARV